MAYGYAHVDLRQLLGSLRTVEETPSGVVRSQESLPTWPFVTVSRQAGAGALAFATTLTERLNRQNDTAHPWQCFDRQLVERIAVDHHLSTELIESLEKSSHTWISEFLRGLSLSDRGTPSELAVFRRVMQTMRALARAGHVVLVGLGGVLITRDMPKGVHVRIVAPFDWRVKNLARAEHTTETVARDRVRLLDRDREAFFAKFWPTQPVTAELFHLTLNAATMSEEQMADALVPLLEPADEPSLGRTR